MLRPRVQLAAESLFLRKQLALYVERQGLVLACDFFVSVTADSRFSTCS